MSDFVKIERYDRKKLWTMHEVKATGEYGGTPFRILESVTGLEFMIDINNEWHRVTVDVGSILEQILAHPSYERITTHGDDGAYLQALRCFSDGWWTGWSTDSAAIERYAVRHDLDEHQDGAKTYPEPGSRLESRSFAASCDGCDDHSYGHTTLQAAQEAAGRHNLSFHPERTISLAGRIVGPSK